MMKTFCNTHQEMTDFVYNNKFCVKDYMIDE